MASTPPYLVRVHLKEQAVRSEEYPFSLPIVRGLDIEFASPVTFFVGENGTGKSTIIEALAALCRLPVSGGGRNELAGTHRPDTVSHLAAALRPSFRRRPPDAYFLRAEFQAQVSLALTPGRLVYRAVGL
jgi:predicted ATPase